MWLACTSPCTSAIARSWASGSISTQSACSATSSASSQGCQRSSRARHTAIVRPRNVSIFGGAVIGCRPTTSARDRNIASTGCCLIEVRSSHSLPASSPAAASTYSSMIATAWRIGVLNTSTSACRARSRGDSAMSPAGSRPITRTPMRSRRNRASQRPNAPWLPTMPTTGGTPDGPTATVIPGRSPGSRPASARPAAG